MGAVLVNSQSSKVLLRKVDNATAGRIVLSPPLPPLDPPSCHLPSTTRFTLILPIMSRADIQAPPGGRKRSNTAHSIFGNAPVAAPPPPIPALPLQIGESRVLTVWVNEPGTMGVKLSHKHCAGVVEGDLLCIASPLQEHEPGFLFVVPAEDSGLKHQLQVSELFSWSGGAGYAVRGRLMCGTGKISLPKAVLEMFGLKSNSEVTLTKVCWEVLCLC